MGTFAAPPASIAITAPHGRWQRFAPAPLDQTLVVAGEARSLTVPHELRSIWIPGENRSLP